MTSRDELAELRKSIVVAVGFSNCERYLGFCIDCQRGDACFREAEKAVALVEADVLRRVRASIKALPHSPDDDWTKLALGQYRARVLAAVDAAGETPDS